MCGRYSLIADLGELARRFEFDGDWLAFDAAYNIAPTQQVLTVRERDGREAVLMRWGLTPSWARTASAGARSINARAETVAEKPSFRTALRRRRCLVPADGFYEWQRTGGSKRPMRVVLKSGEPFAFAGLWDAWRDPQGEWVLSCAIITTAANQLLSPIHHRMPVILPREAEALWLDAAVNEPGPLTDLLASYPADAMDACEVSPLVTSAANNTAEVMERVPQGCLPT